MGQYELMATMADVQNLVPMAMAADKPELTPRRQGRRAREALPGPKTADAKEELAIKGRCRRRQGMVPLAMMLVINVKQLLRRAQALDFGRLGQANDDA